MDVYALRRPDDGPSGLVDGVQVHRLNVQRDQGARLATYLAEYLDFLVRAAMALVGGHRKRQYGLVQVHTLPDFLVFAALPLRLAGVPVLLDLHEAMPEFFRSRFPRASNPVVHRALGLQERLSIAAATHAQTVNDALADRLVTLGVPARKISVVRNSPSLLRFDSGLHPARAFAADGVVRLVYAGALTPTRQDPFTDISLSTKIFEYGAMGKPVVCSRLPMVERTFEPEMVWTDQPANVDDLARTILSIVDDPAAREAGVRRAGERTNELSWERDSRRYVSVVDALVAGRTP